MPQSNVIFAFLFIAFLIFITARGELPSYGRVFFGNSSSPGGVSNAPGQGGSSGGSSAGGVVGSISSAASSITSVLTGVNKIGAFLGKFF